MARPSGAQPPSLYVRVPPCVHGPIADRHGPLQPGDLVQLTDPKGRHHTFALVPGKEFHTHKGKIDHDDLIGRPEGIVVTTVAGVAYLVLRPLLRDFVLSMPRWFRTKLRTAASTSTARLRPAATGIVTLRTGTPSASSPVSARL